MRESTLHLHRAVDEPARARTFVAERLTGCSPAICDDAVLLVSELVSNVFQHGAVPAWMTVQVGEELLHVVVKDSGPALPDLPWAADQQASRGRGLLLVSSIALAWGVDTSDGRVGKEVWFELGLSP